MGRARITSFLGNHGQEVGRKIINPKIGYTSSCAWKGTTSSFDEFRGKNGKEKFETEESFRNSKNSLEISPTYDLL